MNSRMERYQEETLDTSSRISRNQELYNSEEVPLYSRSVSNSNVRVLDTNQKDIDIEKIKKYIIDMNTHEDVKKNRLSDININEDDFSIVEEKETPTKVYDINSVLEKAKEGRERVYENDKYRKLRDTQFDILSKIDMQEKSNETLESEDFNTNERTLIDLINTVTINRGVDLLEELTKGDPSEAVAPQKVNKDDNINSTEEFKFREQNNTVSEETVEEIKEKSNTLVDLKKDEIAKNIDNSFYTSSNSFSKEDFEGFDDIDKKGKKSNKLVIFSVIVLILSVLFTLFVVVNYIFDLGLF
ncbi:MAG: hypothetical protein RSB41_00560 [Bacilli bacterium]